MADTKLPVQGNKLSIVDTTIIDFRNSIKDLARPNLFQVEMLWPSVLTGGTNKDIGSSGAIDGTQEKKSTEEASQDTLNGAEGSLQAGYLIKAANIPASTVTITVLNDDKFQIRSKFENWSSKIQAMQQNRQDAKDIESYQGRARVVQVGRNSQPTRVYEMVGIWPSNISAIDLAWDSNDTPEEYTVELQVQYWTWGKANDVQHGKDKKEIATT